MEFRKPIYVTRKDKSLARDKIFPYSDRIGMSTESKREAAALKLLGSKETDELDGINDILAQFKDNP